MGVELIIAFAAAILFWFLVVLPASLAMERFLKDPVDVAMDLLDYPAAWRLLVRRSRAAEQVIAGMLRTLADDGVIVNVPPRVFLTRRWVPGGTTLGMHNPLKRAIIVNARLAAQEGTRSLRLTLGHELGHHVDFPTARHRLGISRWVNDQIFAEAVGEYLCARRLKGSGISDRSRRSLMKACLLLARRWKRGMPKGDD